MADFKDERAYNSKTLTQVFLVSGLALLICIIWMIWRDYNRPWKQYQREFMQLERSKAVQDKREAVSDIDIAQYKELRQELNQATSDLKSHEDEISKLTDESAKLDSEIFKVKTVDAQPLKAQMDADRYTYSQDTENGRSIDSISKKIQKETDQYNAYTQQLFALNQQKDQVTQDLNDIYAKRDAVKANIDKMLANYHKLKTKISNLSFDFLFYFRNAMLLDSCSDHPNSAGCSEKPA